MTKQSIWAKILKELTFKQYTQIVDSYSKATDGLHNLQYETYFIRTKRISKNKKLIELANLGLSVDINKKLNERYL